MQIQPTTLVKLLRALLPRSFRNAVRRPQITLRRLVDKARHSLGVISDVEIMKGWKVRCHPICRSEFSVFQNDLEQAAEMKCFADHATRNMQFLDVGTHWGVFTLAAIHYGGEGVRVVGIEASSDAVAVYKENLQLNNVSSQVDIINAACGESVGELKMLTTGAGGADYLVVPAGERFDTVTVPQVTIDSTVVGAGFSPTHIKIDVEGFEEEVLRGALQTLRTFKPTVFLELHGLLINNRGKRPQDVLGLLCEAGYSKWLNLDNQVITAEELAACGYNARFIAINSVG